MSIPTILCVDDERNVLFTLRTQLMRCFPDHAIALAASGDEALAIVAELTTAGSEIPLVIAAQNMPGMSGNDLLIALHARYPAMVKVMVTGQTGSGDVSDVVNQGILYRLIAKPWDELDLRLTVAEALRRYEQEQRLAAQQAALAQVNEELAVLAALAQQAQSCTQQLQAAQEFSQQVIDTAQEGIIVWDENLHCRIWNRFMVDLTGLPVDAVLGQYCLDRFPWLQENGVFALLERSLAGETVIAPDRCFTIPETGRTGWSTAQFTPLRDTQGRIMGVLGTVHDITERKQAELALHSRQAELAAVQRIAHLGTWEFDLITKKITWSEELFHLYGLDPTQPEPTDAELQRMIHPDDWQVWQTAISHAIASGTPLEVEHRIIQPDGSIRYTRSRAEVIVNAQGQPIKLVGTALDTTVTELADIALQSSEAQNRAILSAIPDIMTIVNADGRLLSYSYNGPVGEIAPINPNPVGLHVTDLLPPEDANQWLVAIQTVLSTGVMQTFEQQIQFGDRIQYEEVRIVPYKDDAVLSMVRNISDRKQVENSLRQSEAKQAALIQALPDLIMRLSGDGVYLDFFPTSTFKVLRERNSVVGTRVEESLPPHLAQRRMDAIQAALQTGELQIYEQELWVDGAWQIEECRVVRCGDDEVLIIGRDITDRKQAELQLQQTTEELNRFFSVSLDLLCIANLDGYFLRINPAWERALGYSLEELGRCHFLDFVHPDDVNSTLDAIALLADNQEIPSFINRYRHQDGSYRWIEWRSIPVGNLIYAAARDITVRKWAEAQLEAQNVLLARIAKGEPLTDILKTLIQQIEQNLPGALCYVLLLDDEHRLHPAAAVNLPPGYVQAVDGIMIGEGVGSCGTAAFRNETVIVSDIETDPLWQEFRAIALSYGLRACSSIPITGSDGRVLGTFGVYYTEVKSPQPHELEIVEQIANIAGIAIDRDRTEARIRHSEQQLRLTLEFTGIGAWSWHPSTGEYQWTGKMVELLELPPDLDNMFQCWCDRMYPDDVDRVTTSIQQAIATQSSFAEEYRYYLQDGRLVWRWVKGQGIYTETGAVERVLGVVQDITEHKQAEMALYQSEAKNRAMLAAIPDLLLRVKRDGTCLDFLPPGSALEPGFIPIQANMAEVLPPAILQYQQQRMDQAVATGELQVWEQQLNRFGVLCDEEVRLVHCADDEFLIIVRDITQRKQAQLALQRSEEQLRLALEFGRIAIWDWEIATGTLVWNDITYEVLGYQPGTITPTSDVWLQAVHPDDRAAANGEIELALAEQRDFSVEYRVVLPDGTQRWVTDSGRGIYDANGHPVRAIGIMFDITDRKRAEAALRQSEAKNRAIIGAIPDCLLRIGRDGSCYDFIPPVHARSGTFLPVYHHIAEVLPPDVLQYQLQRVEQALATGELQVWEHQILKHGVLCNEEVRLVPCGADECLLIVRDISDRKQAELSLHRTNQLLFAISTAQMQFITDANPGTLFDNLLETLLQLTNSEYGFIGEILYDANGQAYVDESYMKMRGRPYLKTKAITDIAWNAETHQSYDEGLIHGMEFHNLNTLFGQVMVTGQPVISNHPSTDPRRGGLPDGHPSLNAFLGIPFFRGEHLMGMVGIANRPEGYTETLIAELEPFLTTCASTIEAYRNDMRRKQVELALQQSEATKNAIIQAIPDLLIRMDRDGNYKEMIRSDYINVLLPSKPLLVSTVYDVLPQHEAQQRLHYTRLAIDTGNLQMYNQTLKIAGRLCYEEVRIVPLLDQEVLVIIRDITDRTNAELALRESEERRRLALELTETGSWEFDVATGEAIWSDSHYRLMGLEPGESPNNYQTWRERVHPEDVEQVERLFTTALETRSPLDAEYRVVQPNGLVRWVLTKGHGIYNENGQAVRMLGVMMDISDRKIAEAALQEKQQQLMSLLNNIPHIAWLKDRDSRFLAVNEPFAQACGYTASQIVGLTDHDIWSPELAEAYRRDDREVMALRQQKRVEEPLFTAIGMEQWIETIKTPILNEQGEPIGTAGIAMDITERKHIERTLQQLNEELEQRVQQRTQELARSEQDLRTIFNNVYDAILIHDMDGTILDANDRALELRGATREQLLAASIPQLSAPDAPLERLPEFWQRAQAGETMRLEWREQRLSDHSTFDVEVSLRRVTLGNRPVIIAGVRDISDRKRAEAALEAEKLRLQLALDAAQMGTWSCNLHTGVLVWSDLAQEVFGFAPGTFPGDRDTFLSLVYPEDRERVMQAIAHTFETGAPYEIEYRICRLDGEIRWVAVWGIIPHDLPNPERQLVGVISDITDRKRAEAALQEVMTTNQALLNTIPDLILLISRDGTYREAIANTGITTLLPRSQQIGKSVWDVLSADLAQQRMDAIERAFQTNLPQIHEYQIAINGELRYEEARCVVCRENEAMVLVRDITDRKRAEQDLRESRNMLQLVLDTIPQRVFWKNRQSRFLGCNSAFASDYSMDLEDIVGKPDQELPWAAFADLYQADDARVINTRTPKLNYEEPTINMNGETIWIRSSKIPLTNSQGEVIGILGCYDDITDRKQAEQQLRSERLRLQLALEAANMGTWESNLETGIWSERTEAIFGYAPGTFPGDRDAFLKLVHADDQERVFGALNRSFTTRTPYSVEYRINCLNGERRWVAVSGKVVDNEDGSGRRIVGVALDITERKQAEQALRDSEERLRLALTATNQGLYDLNVRTGEAIVSPEYATMLGYDPTTFQETNARWIERLHPDDMASVAATYRAYVAGEISFYKVEFRQRTQNGQWKWILSLGRIVAFDESGQPLRMLGTHTDIDDRKRAEAQLREQEQFLRSIYEGASQPIFVGDVLPDNTIRVVGWNPAAARLVGRSSEEVAGKSVAEIFPAPEAAEILPRFAQCITTQQPATFEECVTLQGQPRWMLSTYNPLFDDAGRVYRVVGTVYDITERKHAEQALQQLNLELEQRVSDRTLELQRAMEAAETANRAKSTFLANMSHELRTPLNAILGFAQLMSRDQSLEPEKRQQLNIINRSGEHLLNLINDILEMSKIEAGRTAFNANAFDLYALLTTLQEMFRLRAIQKDLQLRFECDQAVPQYIETDENKLRQVLINLIGNAVKFTLKGQVIFRVAATSQTEAAIGDGDDALSPSPQTPVTICFEVEDTGPGIDPNEVDSLFEPFIQSRNRQITQEGTGLGLSISRQFVRLMGGELTVSSVPEQGSTFHFSIQVRLAEAASLSPRAYTQQVVSLAPNQPTYRILVVEDQSTNRQLLVQLLSAVGFEVRATTNGQDAIAVWEVWHPHLIWMDMRMPVMNGYEATRQIRERESQNGTQHPVVILALTASAFEEERAKVLGVGCNDFVRKPFQETYLLEKMVEHLGVQYLYAEREPVDLEADIIATPLNAVSALQSLPATLLTQLHQATIQLDNHQLQHLIEQIAPAQPTLAALLADKLDNFDFQQILNLVEQGMAANEAGAE